MRPKRQPELQSEHLVNDNQVRRARHIDDRCANHRKNEVVCILASALNVKPRLWKIPKGIILFLAKTGDYLKLPLTSERLNKLTQSYVVSNQKIKHALNQELPLTSLEGLEITAKSFSNI